MSIFSMYRLSKQGIFTIWLTLKNERSSKNTLLKLRQYMCTFMSNCTVYKEFIGTLHTFHQFEKVSWMEQIILGINISQKLCAGSANEITEQWAENWICFAKRCVSKVFYFVVSVCWLKIFKQEGIAGTLKASSG